MLLLTMLVAVLGVDSPPTTAPADLSAAPPHEFVDGIAVIEAESFVAQSADDIRRWYVQSTDGMAEVEGRDDDATDPATASCGAYIEILPDTRVTHNDEITGGLNFSNKPGVMGVLSYPVKFDEPGRYYVWACAHSVGSEDNGVHIGLNDDWPESGRRIQWCAGKHKWTWSSNQRVPQKHCGDPLTVWLDIEEPGVHMVTLSMREDGVELDRFLLTKDKALNPNRDPLPGE
ncbi:MAG: hypothetical protein AAF743_01665 [Planctomycetota bacterium]